MIVLEMPDHGLDGGTTFELAFDLLIDPAPLAGGVDLELLFGRGIVTAIAGIGDDAIEHIAEERLHIGDDFGKSVPVIRVAGKRGDMGDELAAGGMLHWCRDAHLHTELVGLVRFALANAFDLRRMKRMDLAPALMAVLGQHAARQAQLVGKDLFQSIIARDPPSDVADHPTQIGFELA